MELKKKYQKRILCMIAGQALCLLACALYLSARHKIPDRVKIRAGEREEMNFAIPASGMLHAV